MWYQVERRGKNLHFTFSIHMWVGKRGLYKKRNGQRRAEWVRDKDTAEGE